VFLIAMTFVFKAEAEWAWIVLMGLGDFLLPIFFLLNSFRNESISDLDLTKREERLVWFSIAAGFWILTLIVILIVDPLGFKIPNIMKLFQIWLAIFGTLNAGITYVWKISGHAMAATAWSLWLAFLWNPWFALGLITLVPIVSWGRLRLNKHTPAQIVAGILLMLLVTPAVWFYFAPIFSVP
jgi:membrane-associated phospholipid phosphatase